MDHQAQRGRSPSTGHQQHLINQSQMPSSGPFPTGDASIGLNIGLNQIQHQHRNSSFAHPSVSDPTAFDPINSFAQQQPSGAGPDSTLAFNANPQPGFLSPDLGDGDFSLFPPGSQSDQFNTPLFDQSTALNPGDINSMNSPQVHHSPTPPHLLQPDAHIPGSAQQSPSFNQHQFSSPPGGHSRHASLGPEAALLPNQLGEWNQPQFQRHRRTPSEYSDVSSVSPSPNLASADSFDIDPAGHSPLQRPSDGSLYQEVLGIGSFTLNDHSSPGHPGHSPSHSPAISPRLIPQQPPDMNNNGFGLVSQHGNEYGIAPPYMQTNETFPPLHTTGGHDVSQVPPPAINIDFAPPNNSKTGNFQTAKSQMDQDSLTPPERGRQRGRQRAVTDPFHTIGGIVARPGSSSSLSPAMGSDIGSRDSSRSLSPLDRQGSSPSRRRQSTSAVPNNVIALRLADPEYRDTQDPGSSKRVQKHPATFQCTLCPKRFTRAYNLRSHLRTHTDERPFVCNVCGKAFARQHDRKRHESLHSGEKKFVCKGDLKAGGQWGCGRRFARADALGRHFRSEAGRICIKPLLDEEMIERQRQWQEQRMHQNMAHNLNQGPMGMDPTAGSAYPMDASGNYTLPAALLAQYPALAQMNWSAQDMGGGIDDEISGRSSFDASDYDEAEDGGYVSGPGTGFGDGGMNQNFGEMGYASDFGGR
ncbi:C2H2 finger domain transcription factor crzA [Paramyrothecium foliicola]|nr:C2H2 finger domain transcription factor crzA [Paramyrothecium foliicola]